MSLLELLFVDPRIRSIPVTKEVALRDLPPDESLINTHLTDYRRRKDVHPMVQAYSPNHVTGFNMFNIPINTFLSCFSMRLHNHSMSQALSVNDSADGRQGRLDHEATTSKDRLAAVLSLANIMPQADITELATKLADFDNDINKYNAQIRTVKEFCSGMDKWLIHWVMLVIVSVLFYIIMQSNWYINTATGNGKMAETYSVVSDSLVDTAVTLKSGTKTVRNTVGALTSAFDGIVNCVSTGCFLPGSHQSGSTIGAGPFENEGVSISFGPFEDNLCASTAARKTDVNAGPEPMVSTSPFSINVDMMIDNLFFDHNI